MCTDWTHAFAGVAIARLATGRKMPWLYWGLAAFLPVIPDFDVFSIHAYDNSPLAHRGLTHSLFFALALGLLAAALTFRKFIVPLLDLWGVFFVVTASHGILDALNRHTAGVALFWPFSSARYGPWGPIPVPDIAFQLPDPRTSQAVRGELLWVWLPLGAAVIGMSAYRFLARRRAAAAKAAPSSAPSAPLRPGPAVGE